MRCEIWKGLTSLLRLSGGKAKSPIRNDTLEQEQIFVVQNFSENSSLKCEISLAQPGVFEKSLSLKALRFDKIQFTGYKNGHRDVLELFQIKFYEVFGVDSVETQEAWA